MISKNDIYFLKDTSAMVITITGDSTEVIKSGLPYPIDATWEMGFKKTQRAIKIMY